MVLDFCWAALIVVCVVQIHVTLKEWRVDKSWVYFGIAFGLLAIAVISVMFVSWY